MPSPRSSSAPGGDICLAGTREHFSFTFANETLCITGEPSREALRSPAGLFFLLFHTRVLFQGKEKLGGAEKCLAGVGRGCWMCCSSWLRPFWIDAALKLCGSRGVLL